MSDQPGTESFEDDLGSVSLDDGVDAGSGQDGLLDSSEGDNEPSSPPDLQPRATEWGTTASEQHQEESIEQRPEYEDLPNGVYRLEISAAEVKRKNEGTRDEAAGFKCTYDVIDPEDYRG